MELSEKEKKVIDMMSVGFRRAEIALKLNISQRTVDSYHEKIKAKMGVKTLHEALYKYGWNNGTVGVK